FAQDDITGMTCCHYYAIAEGRESAFSVDVASISFGPGVLKEVGEHARSLGMKRVALFTDPRVKNLECVADALSSLRNAGCDVSVYDEVQVEPIDAWFQAAALFAAEGRFEGYVSVGGGSVRD